MKSIAIVIMLLAGIIFVGSVMLMSPKGWLGVAIGGGVGASNEYGSKKSLESTLKKSALVSLIIFLVAALLVPYLS